MGNTITLTREEVREVRRDAKRGGGCMFFLMTNGECNPATTVPHTPLCNFCKRLAKFVEQEKMENKDEALRETILSLSFDWQSLRDMLDYGEYRGHDCSDLRKEMAQLQDKIRRLKDEMVGTEEPIRTAR